MSRPTFNRPKTSAGLPTRSTVGGFGERDGEDTDSRRTATPALRLPSLSGARPLLRRQPLHWTKAPGGKPTVLIGRGGIGRVFEGKFDGRKVAVKEVSGGPGSPLAGQLRPLGNRRSDSGYLRELRGAEFLLSLRHENIVRYLQFDTSRPGFLYVVMELVEGSNLTERQRARPFSDAEMQSVIAQTCRGLSYLHSHRPPIVHRDVKGANIMLTSRHRAVLIDLGFAILCPECAAATDEVDEDNDPPAAGTSRGQQVAGRSLAGTHGFIAPEVYERHAYSAKSDVFALGCTAFELQCGRRPHADKSNDMAVCYAVCFQPMPELPPGCNSRLADLYRKCTLRNPEMRPAADRILRHSFLVGDAEL